MRTRAVVALRDMLEAGGEILPLHTDDGVPLYVLNVTRVLDALDVERSKFMRAPEDGRIMCITTAAFHEALVRDVDFFKLPLLRAATTYVGQRFIDRVRAAGLEGVDFEPVWSPEGGPVPVRLW